MCKRKGIDLDPKFYECQGEGCPVARCISCALEIFKRDITVSRLAAPFLNSSPPDSIPSCPLGHRMSAVSHPVEPKESGKESAASVICCDGCHQEGIQKDLLYFHCAECGTYDACLLCACSSITNNSA